MLYHVLASVMVMVAGVGAEEIPPDFEGQVHETLKLEYVPPPERPEGTMGPGEMGKRYGLALMPYLRPYVYA